MQNVLSTLKGKGKEDSPRLFLLFARNNPTAVIFRRGPSHWVQLIRWNTAEDVFEYGQWFRGRLYERRSDLSPDGSLLIYFAQKINGRTLEDKEYTYAWTAISRPPYLSALALWPKGDCWHGGGSFWDNATVELNHKPDRKAAHPKHEPRGLQVKLRRNVSGEDDPIYSERLERDGWHLKQQWEVEFGGKWHLYHTVAPEVREKARNGTTLAIRLTRSITELDYSEEFAVIDQRGSICIPIDGASWVDWDQRGRLIIARKGKVSVAEIEQDGSVQEALLLDSCGSKPSPVASPGWARNW